MLVTSLTGTAVVGGTVSRIRSAALGEQTELELEFLKLRFSGIDSLMKNNYKSFGPLDTLC